MVKILEYQTERARVGLVLARDDFVEGLHDLRVAVRRMRGTDKVWRDVLRGTTWSEHKVRGELRRLHRDTGSLRDADVGRALLRELFHGTALEAAARDPALMLPSRQDPDSTNRHELLHALSARVDRIAAFLSPMSHSPDEADTPQPSFATALLPRLTAAWEELRARLERGGKTRAWHRTRIRGKNVRYAIEPTIYDAPEAKQSVSLLKELQDDLGAVNDIAVLRKRIAACANPNVVAAVRERHRELRVRAHTRWQGAGKDELDRAIAKVQQALSKHAAGE